MVKVDYFARGKKIGGLKREKRRKEAEQQSMVFPPELHGDLR